MRILLHGPEDLTVTDFGDPEFQVVPEAEGVHFSAMEMFATSIVLCTYSVLVSYAEQAATDTTGLAVRMGWAYHEDPYRIGDIQMDISWPGIPESRLQAAERAAEQCTLHHTLQTPPNFETRVHQGPV
ncbi:OsmC family protein [Thiohalorhabdus sp.]|uniref:OsmC family protein n=1 Tax=Thiohalorhabdus sp. TaxID=3094134 RepID=UPI002FC3067A